MAERLFTCMTAGCLSQVTFMQWRPDELAGSWPPIECGECGEDLTSAQLPDFPASSTEVCD